MRDVQGRYPGITQHRLDTNGHRQKLVILDPVTGCAFLVRAVFEHRLAREFRQNLFENREREAKGDGTRLLAKLNFVPCRNYEFGGWNRVQHLWAHRQFCDIRVEFRDTRPRLNERPRDIQSDMTNKGNLDVGEVPRYRLTALATAPAKEPVNYSDATSSPNAATA